MAPPTPLQPPPIYLSPDMHRRHFDISPQQAGRYQSFPYLIEDPKTHQPVAIYRKATMDETDQRVGMKVHGLDGAIWMRHFYNDTQQWSDPVHLLGPEGFEPGLIDSAVSLLGQKICWVFRRYPHPHNVFVSVSDGLDELPYPTELSAHDAFYDYAQWGRVVEMGNTWLMVIYGINEETHWWRQQCQSQYPLERAALYASSNQGQSWRFHSWIGSTVFVDDELCANETAVEVIGDRLYALMRTGWRWPGPMYLCRSDDGGLSWSRPRFSGLYGEAPMWRTLPNGQVMVGFRGFAGCTEAGVGGTFSIATFDTETEQFGCEIVVESYHGNQYDGGYGDIIGVADTDQLLCAYYYSDQLEPRNPWIRGCLLQP